MTAESCLQLLVYDSPKRIPPTVKDTDVVLRITDDRHLATMMGPYEYQAINRESFFMLFSL